MNRTRFVPAAVALAGMLALSACASGPVLNPILLSPETLNETAPDVFHARFVTTRGTFVIEVRRDWSPNGADRFYNLVSNGFYDNVRFHRVIAGSLAQFGIHGDSAVAAAWRERNIEDDPVVESNTRASVSYATSGPNTRSTQVFVNIANNTQLDALGFAPFGRVVEGMSVVNGLYSGYGEGAPNGRGPDHTLIEFRGNSYLRRRFPELDFIREATIVPLQESNRRNP